MLDSKVEVKSVNELQKMVKELEIVQDTIQRVQIAKKFIEENLADQEQDDAELIINISIKQHFSFEKDVLNMLKKYYKLCHHEFLGKQKLKSTFGYIPAWYKYTDSGLKFMSGVLAAELAKTENLISVVSSYYQYQNGVYTALSDESVNALILDKLLITEANMYSVTDTAKQLQLLVRKDKSELNVNPFLINVKNGIYDVKNDILVDHDPSILSTIQINANYSDSECPRFINWLFEAMNGDEGQVYLLQEVMGYCLIPITDAQKCFILRGEAAAGKSLFLNVLQDVLLGAQNASNIPWHKLKERFTVAEMQGKLINVFADLPDEKISDNGMFKALVGQDYVVGEKKHKDLFQFKSTARMLFSCNQMPQNGGDNSDGFYRRLLIIPFLHSVPEEQRNPNLINEFREEADGIFMFALKGLKRLISQNFKFSETDVNRQELERYRYEGNPVFAFLNAACEIAADEYITTQDLYEEFKRFCAQNGFEDCAINKFVMQVKAYFPCVISKVDTKGQKRILKGIKYQ
jgi:putative DNA primase/helicase